MPLPTEPVENPLRLLTDQQLLDTQLSVALQCLRSRSSVRKKHSEKTCVLWQILNLEGDRRGIQNKQPPYTA